MRWSDLDFDPSLRKLRHFAALWVVFFGGLACWHSYREGRVAVAVVLVAAAGLPGLIVPRIMRPVYVAWMALAFPIGWTVSRVILAVLFFGLFTPMGLVFRLAGRDPLDRRPDRGRASCWVPRRTPSDPSRYFDQF